MTKQVTALIPMRHQSQRVPFKNMKQLCDKPLFHWIVQSLQACEWISQVVIDTDSDEIAQNATENFDVKILKRPEHLCGEMVSVNDLIAYQISQLDGDVFLQTHSTNPLLTTSTLNQAIGEFFTQNEFDSVFSVTQLQTRLYWQDGKPVNHNPLEMLRTQDLPPLYEENSNFYIFTRQSFAKQKTRIGLTPKMFVMDKLEATDIDEMSDFILAEILMQQRLQQKLKDES